jgi:regulatory protein
VPSPRRPLAPSQLKPLREVAFQLLSHSEHTAAQLKTKLRRKGYEATAIHVLVEELVSRDYLNDARAAALLTQRRASGSRWGRGKITQELSAKGISKELAQQSLASLEEAGHDWLATATALLQKKYPKPLPDLREERQKEQARRLGFLLRRGFSSSQAQAALKQTQALAADDDVG